MIASTTAIRTAADGTTLQIRSWEPPGSPRASIVLIHGLGEHSGRYEHVGSHLAAAGFAVDAPDLRGFGSSGGRPAYVRSFDEYLDDLDPLVAETEERGMPVALLGHSMGGLIALRYAQTRGRPGLLILSSPSVDATIPAVKKAAARVLSVLAPTLTLANDIEGAQLSRDPSVGEDYFADPLVHTRTTTGLGGAFLAAMADARAADVPPPALVIHGEQDPLVPVRFSAPLADDPGVSRVTFPDFRHESFNEEGGAIALETVTAWLEDQLA